jgi:hypothetical protein
MKKQEIYYGKIKQFGGSWGSGIGFLLIENDKGHKLNIPCENSPTVRALDCAFGDVITDGHTANGEGYKNKYIYFFLDDFGLLNGFVPEEEASQELIDKYNTQ